MGTGYTTLDPSRRKFPPLIHSNEDVESPESETDVGDGSSSPVSSRADYACMTDPGGAGGMGFHYGNVELIDL